MAKTARYSISKAIPKQLQRFLNSYSDSKTATAIPNKVITLRYTMVKHHDNENIEYSQGRILIFLI